MIMLFLLYLKVDYLLCQLKGKIKINILLKIVIVNDISIGYKLDIQHIGMPTGKPILLETISVSPRIFKILNFFTNEEAFIPFWDAYEFLLFWSFCSGIHSGNSD